MPLFKAHGRLFPETGGMHFGTSHRGFSKPLNRDFLKLLNAFPQAFSVAVQLYSCSQRSSMESVEGNFEVQSVRGRWSVRNRCIDQRPSSSLPRRSDVLLRNPHPESHAAASPDARQRHGTCSQRDALAFASTHALDTQDSTFCSCTPNQPQPVAVACSLAARRSRQDSMHTSPTSWTRACHGSRSACGGHADTRSCK